MWVYIWLGITALALIVEFITSEVVSIWFVGGGLVSVILSLFDVSWQITLPVFIAVSLVLLFSFRKIMLKYFLKGESKTNAESVIGGEFTLLSDIDFESPGTIKVNDVIWNVITENEHDHVDKGSVVVIKNIRGNKYIVEVKK